MSRIQKLMERGCKILGSEYAILGGAMTWVSESNLVSAMCNNGIFGVLASGAMDGDLLKKEIEQTQAKTTKNFGVNLILANPKLQDLIDVCLEKKVSHVILAGGIPDKSIFEKIHNGGAQVMSFAPSLAVAKRLFKQGLDSLILEGSEAGGHVGPVTTMILIQDILLNLKEYPIFVAGGILRGEVFAAMLQLGALGCQLGTVFACCKESLAHPNFKKAFFRANGRNAVTPVQLDKKFPIAPVRALENIGTEEFIAKQREVLRKFENGEVGLENGRLSLEHFWAGALRRAVQEGDVERGSLMSGQIVEIIKEERSIAEIVHTIMEEAENFLKANCAAQMSEVNKSNLKPFVFKTPLVEGIIEKRKSQFTMQVNYEGQSYHCHCPTTGRIGNLDLAGRPCLLSSSADTSRKTAFTVEAISLNQPKDAQKSWIGINQNAVNRYVEHFLRNGGFSKMIDGSMVYREKILGNSKLDFLVGDTFIEVKTPLQCLQIEIPSHVKTKKVTPFSGTDRMTRHITELGNSLNTNQRAIMLVCFIYDNPGFQVIEKSTKYEKVKRIVDENVAKGVEIWQANFKITPSALNLEKYFRIEVK